MTPSLSVVTYHYIRDLPRSPFPRLKGMLSSAFREQVAQLKARYEMATLESAVAFLQGDYAPARDLCLLTFDDGLKEHYAEVAPVLADHGIQGIFFPITGCLQDGCVAAVHMNHFLMAAGNFEDYRAAFLRKLEEVGFGDGVSPAVDSVAAQRTYRWDTPEVAAFKYLFNFVLDGATRDGVVKSLFRERLGDEQAFARTLYLDWDQAREMQAAGMILGGHSHRHQQLAGLSDEELEADLTECERLLKANLHPQPIWPFSYPYGKRDSYTDATVRYLGRLGFRCSFSTEYGVNHTGAGMFALRRLDYKEIPVV